MGFFPRVRAREIELRNRQNGMNRMRLGPGKHLHGHKLMGGMIEGKDYDYFQSACCCISSVQS